LERPQALQVYQSVSSRPLSGTTPEEAALALVDGARVVLVR
jgi:hypothetical protein